MQLFKGKVKILENLRLELDGSRRDHITIENKIAKQESKAQEVDTKHTAHIQSKDASVAGTAVNLSSRLFTNYIDQWFLKLLNIFASFIPIALRGSTTLQVIMLAGSDEVLLFSPTAVRKGDFSSHEIACKPCFCWWP